MLEKNTSWVRFAKKGKKWGINGEKQTPGGCFWVGMRLVNGVNVQPRGTWQAFKGRMGWGQATAASRPTRLGKLVSGHR